MKKRMFPINVTKDGCAFTIVSRYEGRAYIQYMTAGGGYYPCTGVMEIYEYEEDERKEMGVLEEVEL